MSMRYTGNYRKRVLNASGETLIERIKLAKYNEALSKLGKGESVSLSMLKQLQKEVKNQIDKGFLSVSGRW